MLSSLLRLARSPRSFSRVRLLPADGAGLFWLVPPVVGVSPLLELLPWLPLPPAGASVLSLLPAIVVSAVCALAKSVLWPPKAAPPTERLSAPSTPPVVVKSEVS